VATYLLTWNPDRWHWTEEEILEDIAQIDNLGLEVFNRVNDNSLDGASAPTIKESNQATVYSLYGSAVSLAAFFIRVCCLILLPRRPLGRRGGPLSMVRGRILGYPAKSL